MIQATSEEAPGLLASVAHHLGAQHSPDLFHGQHELCKTVSASMAAQQRAAAKALAKGEETLNRVHEPLDNGDDEPQKREPGRFPQAGERLEQVAQDVDAARHEPQRVAGPRETVT